jgi:hypothetical protein
MNIMELAAVVTLYFILTMLALAWAVNRSRHQFDGDLRWHREILLKEIRAELLTQENHLESSIRTR